MSFRLSLHSLAALFFIVSQGQLSAQVNNFQPAYYLDLQGDTISASISQDGDLFLSKFIKVKTNGSDRMVEMRPLEILGFGFPEQDLHYRKLMHTYVPESGEKIEVPRFARRLVAGYYDLYRLEQFAGEFNRKLSKVPSHTYYLEKPSGETFKLEQVEETVTGTKYRIIDRYKGGLKYLMADWELARKEADKLSYSDEDLVGIINRYNHGKKEMNVPIKLPKESFKERKIRFRGILPIGTLGKNHAHKNGFGGSLSYAFYNPRFSNSVQIGIGIGFFHSNFGESRIDIYNIQDESLLAIRAPLYFDYYLSRVGEFKPKVKILLVPSFVSAKRFVLSSQLPGRFPRTLNREDQINTPAFFYGAGIGVETKNIEVNLIAERSQFLAFNNSVLDFNAVIFLSLGVEYHFMKNNRSKKK